MFIGPQKTQFDYKSPKINCGSDFRSDRGRNKTSLLYTTGQFVIFVSTKSLVKFNLSVAHCYLATLAVLSTQSWRCLAERGCTVSYVYIYFIYHAQFSCPWDNLHSERERDRDRVRDTDRERGVGEREREGDWGEQKQRERTISTFSHKRLQTLCVWPSRFFAVIPRQRVLTWYCETRDGCGDFRLSRIRAGYVHGIIRSVFYRFYNNIICVYILWYYYERVVFQKRNFRENTATGARSTELSQCLFNDAAAILLLRFIITAKQ